MIKKLLFAGALALAFNSVNAQSVIFEDSFETYTDFAIANVGSWTLRDVDLKTTPVFRELPNSGVAKSFQFSILQQQRFWILEILTGR
jgi:hypothetical protein